MSRTPTNGRVNTKGDGHELRSYYVLVEVRRPVYPDDPPAQRQAEVLGTLTHAQLPN